MYGKIGHYFKNFMNLNKMRKERKKERKKEEKKKERNAQTYSHTYTFMGHLGWCKG